MRALYQRKKGRDLYDLWLALGTGKTQTAERIIECFQRYMTHDGASVSRAEFEANLSAKLASAVILEDILVRGDEVGLGDRWRPSLRWWQSVSLENIAESFVGDLVPEICQGCDSSI